VSGAAFQVGVLTRPSSGPFPTSYGSVRYELTLLNKKRQANRSSAKAFVSGSGCGAL